MERIETDMSGVGYTRPPEERLEALKKHEDELERELERTKRSITELGNEISDKEAETVRQKFEGHWVLVKEENKDWVQLLHIRSIRKLEAPLMYQLENDVISFNDRRRIYRICYESTAYCRLDFKDFIVLSSGEAYEMVQRFKRGYSNYIEEMSKTI